MRLVYKQKRPLLILRPIELNVKEGTEVETKDKNFIKDLKALGFEVVEVAKDKEDE